MFSEYSQYFSPERIVQDKISKKNISISNKN